MVWRLSVFFEHDAAFFVDFSFFGCLHLFLSSSACSGRYGLLKGTVPQDFRLQVYFMNQFPLSPWVYHFFENSQIKVHDRCCWHRGQMIHEKTWSKKSRNTVPLSTIFTCRMEANDLRSNNSSSNSDEDLSSILLSILHPLQDPTKGTSYKIVYKSS